MWFNCTRTGAAALQDGYPAIATVRPAHHDHLRLVVAPGNIVVASRRMNAFKSFKQKTSETCAAAFAPINWGLPVKITHALQLLVDPRPAFNWEAASSTMLAITRICLPASLAHPVS